MQAINLCSASNQFVQKDSPSPFLQDGEVLFWCREARPSTRRCDAASSLSGKAKMLPYDGDDTVKEDTCVACRRGTVQEDGEGSYIKGFVQAPSRKAARVAAQRASSRRAVQEGGKGGCVEGVVQALWGGRLWELRLGRRQCCRPASGFVATQKAGLGGGDRGVRVVSFFCLIEVCVMGDVNAGKIPCVCGMSTCPSNIFAKYTKREWLGKSYGWIGCSAPNRAVLVALCTLVGWL
jgi:hypothetical protein